LPDKDIRKRFTNRQGKTGFSGDVIRNFITAQHTAINQLARLAYADKIRGGVAAAYAELQGNPDALRLAAFIDEIALRAGSEMTPNVSQEFNWDKFAALGNQVVFYYMLSSAKSAFVQTTQLAIVGLPVLAAEYGTTETAKVAGRYSMLFNSLGTFKYGPNGDVETYFGAPTVRDSNYVHNHPDANYRRVLTDAWNDANDRDLFMSTYASDMTSRARAPSAKYYGPLSVATRSALNLMGGLFHHMERMSREIMYMSTFELEFARAKKQGKTDKEAYTQGVAKARELTYEALFNYSQYNKPRIMKPALLRIATQFLSFAVQMNSFMVRNFYGMLPLLNEEGKKEAAKKFFGTLGMAYMFAGMTGLGTGLIGYSTFAGLMDALKEMQCEGSDDPYCYDDDLGNPLGKINFDLWFRNIWIPETFGPGSPIAEYLGLTASQAEMLATAMESGPISAITNLNIGASTSLDTMFNLSPNPSATAREWWQELVYSFMGPFGGMAENMAGAIDDFNNGDFKRGIEKIMPAFFRGAFKAARVSEEGEKTARGYEFLSPEEYTFGRAVANTLGFASTDVARVQKSNFIAKKLEVKLQAERTKLLADLRRAVARFDENPSDANDEAVSEAYDAIDEFNVLKGFGSLLITPESERKALEGFDERRDAAYQGLYTNPGVQDIIYPLVEGTRMPAYK